MMRFIQKTTRPSSNSTSDGFIFFFILYLLAQIKLLHQKLNELATENEQLKSKLRHREAQLFGHKSEKQNKLNDSSNRKSNKQSKSINNSNKQENSPDQSKSKTRKRGAQKGHKGNGRKIPKNLTEVECLHEIPEAQRQCEICQEPFQETSIPEISYEVDVQVNYVLKKHIRKVYKKTCDCPHPLITAPAPTKIIPKGKFSIGFWSKVLVDKFLMQIPIHRQVFQMKLHNLFISKGTIFKGFKSLSKYLLPLYEQYRKESQKEHHHHADETRWKIFVEIIGKKCFNWWLWVFAGKKVIFYIIDKTRSAKVPKEHLKNFFSRILNVDRYSAYKTLADTIQLAYCWSHVRRDFINILIRYPHKKALVTWANKWIKWIGQLYALNKQRLAVRNDPVRFEKKQQELQQAVLNMQKRSQEKYALPEQQKIMTSLQNHWQGLTLFVDNPDIPMDNNIAERMLRMPVIGRKNYYGNHSEFGGLFSAMMFTFSQTCILHRINPYAYLKYYLTECARIDGVPQNLEQFMPHRLRKFGPKELFIE